MGPRRGEADAAFQHYRTRFDKLFREAGHTATSAFDRMNDWLGG